VTAHRTRRLAAAGAAALAVGLLPACSGGGSSTACPSPTPGGDAAAVPAGLDLRPYAVVTRAERQGEFVTAAGVSDLDVTDLADQLERDAEGAGFTVLRRDDEGIESELYLSRGANQAGSVQIKIDPKCEGRTLVDLAVSGLTG
jgi:hypothetical protein